MHHLKIAILYDAAEDQAKTEAEAAGRKLTLTCETVREVLTRQGHEVEVLAAPGKVRELVTRMNKLDADVVLNLCESLGGSNNHEQDVAMLLELLGKGFTGSGSIGLALAQDKELSKKLMHFHAIPFPRFSVMDAGKVDWADDLEFPLFVKPLNQDASIGIGGDAMVRTIKELMERISAVHTAFGVPALIEEYIEGREIYVAVLGNDPPEALPILEMDFSKVPEGKHRFASSEVKWDEDSELYKATSEFFPEDIPPEVYRRMQEAAVTAFKALRLRDYGRVDMRLRVRRTGPGQAGAEPAETWEFFVIEANPNPDLDRRGEVATAARKAGMTYGQLLDRIISLALARSGLTVGLCPVDVAGDGG